MLEKTDSNRRKNTGKPPVFFLKPLVLLGKTRGFGEFFIHPGVTKVPCFLAKVLKRLQRRRTFSSKRRSRAQVTEKARKWDGWNIGDQRFFFFF